MPLLSRITAGLWLAALACVPAARAQQAPGPPAFPPALVNEMRRVRDAAMASDYAYRQTAHLTDKIGPRMGGSPELARAVEYVAAEMRRLGLEVRLEKAMVPHWQRGEERAQLLAWPDSAPGLTRNVALTALGGSGATPPGGLTADVVAVRTFEDLDALGRNGVAGKIVVFTYPFDKALAERGLGLEAYLPARVFRSEGPMRAAALGARAALVRSVGSADFRLPHTGFTGFGDGVTPIPAGALAAEDADLIARLAAEGTVRMRLVLTPRTLPDAVSYNVVADLKGTEHPEQVVIVSGHLDSWDLGDGAIDDASGVAMAMQTAQLLRQLNLRPKRTIRVVAWTAEETGSAGAEQYVRDHAQDLPNHFAAIESDLGAGRPMGFSAALAPETLALLAPVSSVLDGIGAGLSRRVDDAEPDIAVLQQKGVPALGLWQDSRTYFHYHHSAADTLDKVDRTDLARNAAVMAVLAYGLANMNGSLRP